MLHVVVPCPLLMYKFLDIPTPGTPHPHTPHTRHPNTPTPPSPPHTPTTLAHPHHPHTRTTVHTRAMGGSWSHLVMATTNIARFPSACLYRVWELSGRDGVEVGGVGVCVVCRCVGVWGMGVWGRGVWEFVFFLAAITQVDKTCNDLVKVKVKVKVSMGFIPQCKCRQGPG